MHLQEFINEAEGLVFWVEEDTSKEHGQPRYTVKRAGYWKNGTVDVSRETFIEDYGKYANGIEAFEVALELAGYEKSRAKEELAKVHAKVRCDQALPETYEPRGRPSEP